ncbi:lysosomal acid phosphatase [Drosophila nasuta]|uniref:lysosomal acid phosphatase n=1 Tax=Drosophila nasuta TaxID=42062 RepID=UPI00295F29FA|nr:lysosomal acid phosphatase [Drosophila nasuta]
MFAKQIVGLLLCLGCCLLVSGGIVKDSQDEQPNSDSTLELVTLLFRHGPRTPVNTYPKDPYLNETYEPYGWGQLTNGGKLELYKIGKQLRKRYRQFLPAYYRPDTVHAQSTESSRTMASLQMVLAGMFPPENTPMEWNKKLNWQPIPIVTEPEKTDLRLRQKVPCPRYYEAVWEVMHTPEVVALHEANAQLMKELHELTGFNVTYSHHVTDIYISLQTQLAYGLEVPEWAKDYFPIKMRPLATKSYTYDAYTDEMKKLKGGYFLADLYKQLQAKIAGELKPADRKFFIYCAHDWTVANVLSALDVWGTQMPRFSALIAFELHKRKDTGEYFVEIYFQNDPSKEPKLLQVPGCDKQCPVSKLVELSKNVLPDAPYEQMCVAKGTSDGTIITYH